MAKLISPVWSIIRGSIAGTTYLSGPSNTIIARQKTAPVNPASGPQSIIREGLVNASALWKEVIDADGHEKWNAYAATLSPSGPLGPYEVTGQNAFIQAYVTAFWMEQWGASITPGVDAPDLTGYLDVGGYLLVDRVSAGTGFQLNATNYSGEAAVISVQLSNAWTESKNFFKGPWDPEPQFFDIAASTSSSFDVDTSNAGYYKFARIKAISAEPPLRTQNATIQRHIVQTV